MKADEQLEQMLRDLGQALVNAIETAPEAGEAVRKIRRRGYSLYLVLDREEGEKGAQIELTAGRTTLAKKPVFLLNKCDVSFLESVGIDATRPGRRRRA